jgi:hypothetical protein
MFGVLNKPVKVIVKKRKKLVNILLFGLFIFLFLFLFKPFGLTTLKTFQCLFVTFGFGLVTIFMLIILSFLLNPLLKTTEWTLGKSILWDLFSASSIGAANYFYVIVIFPQKFGFIYLLSSVLIAILVGIIPVTISYIILINQAYKSALEKAAIPPSEVLWQNEVVIRAGNPKNEFHIDPKKIVYISSNDNYVTLVTLSGESIIKDHLRGTLKATEEELKGNSRFLRCHKCYIVNTEFADSITGNAQSLKIRLKIANTEIPVSRSRAADVQKFLDR